LPIQQPPVRNKGPNDSNHSQQFS